MLNKNNIKKMVNKKVCTSLLIMARKIKYNSMIKLIIEVGIPSLKGSNNSLSE